MLGEAGGIFRRLFSFLLAFLLVQFTINVYVISRREAAVVLSPQRNKSSALLCSFDGQDPRNVILVTHFSVKVSLYIHAAHDIFIVNDILGFI